MEITKKDLVAIFKSPSVKPVLKECVKELIKDVLIEEGLRGCMNRLTEILSEHISSNTDIAEKPRTTTAKTLLEQLPDKETIVQGLTEQKNPKPNKIVTLDDAIDDAIKNNPAAVEMLAQEEAMKRGI